MFAERLREQGIDANATPRDLRGQTRKSKKPSVYFAEKRGTSTVLKSKFQQARQELEEGSRHPSLGRSPSSIVAVRPFVGRWARPTNRERKGDEANGNGH